MWTYDLVWYLHDNFLGFVLAKKHVLVYEHMAKDRSMTNLSSNQRTIWHGTDICFDEMNQVFLSLGQKMSSAC